MPVGRYELRAQVSMTSQSNVIGPDFRELLRLCCQWGSRVLSEQLVTARHTDTETHDNSRVLTLHSHYSLCLSPLTQTLTQRTLLFHLRQPKKGPNL